MKLDPDFAARFNADRLLVFGTPCWSVLVRQGQVTLGSLVLAANRRFLSASELSADELKEFPEVVGRMEGLLRSAFGFDKINYLCLMMVDAHYHFHVLPRYATPRHFAGREWVDQAWPKPPVLGRDASDPHVLEALREELIHHDRGQ